MKRALLLLLTVLGVAAQAAEPPPALDLRETLLQLPVTVQDTFGRRETRTITVTTFRPPGDGPFPLLVLNHGRATQDRRAGQGRQRYEPQARYFVSLGFAVFIPTRVGYGDTYGDFDPEFAGDCQAMRPAAASQAAADQVLATVALARMQPWVDASRWVVMGASLGGLTTLATAARNPPGLVAAVNFAGGHGGRPDTNPGNSCSPAALSTLWQQQGAAAALPTLWLYWLNDRYWGADWPQRWAKSWQEGGGKAEFHALPEAGVDGHQGFVAQMDQWVPIVESYLARAGFARSGVVARPPASGFAALDDVARVPASASARENLYARFLKTDKRPRAFAVGPNGSAGFASGDWALGRALGFCQAIRGLPCKLYAVDDDVVWPAAPTPASAATP
jgi:dienelactone hydrolase